jgi:hypothetical protein
MGEQQAAITIAAIYQRQDQINSAGGYLRSLTERAKAGKFSVWPMVMALLRAKLDGKAAGNGAEAAAVDLETAGRLCAPNPGWKSAMRCAAVSTDRGAVHDGAGFDPRYGAWTVPAVLVGTSVL